MNKSIAVLSASLISCSVIAREASPGIRVDTLLETTTSWDGEPYASYPAGSPKLSVLRIVIAPHSVMNWHSHPAPNAAYVLSGQITVETKDGESRSFKAGEAVAETVGRVHRGVTGNEPAVLLVFYAGSRDVPLSRPAEAGQDQTR